MRSGDASVPTPIFPDLAGKVAIVTGGSKGIGAATCRALAANGVSVAVVARENADIERLVGELRETGAQAIGLSADCTSLEALDEARSSIEASLGPVHILAAFAGGFESRTSLLETSEEEWRSVLDANLTSTFLTLKCFVPGMVDRGGGAVVTMASNAGRHLDSTLTAHYAAAKAGVVMLTRHAALEVAARGVRVNCVAPATTLSERIARTMSTERLERMIDLAPLRRLGRPDDTAFATLYLASDAASWVTGVTLDITGGRVML
ncbi:MAG: SDR family NAD(P)-dependent oxidoreductase [Candidatus Dormiibacterota bacterium]